MLLGQGNHGQQLTLVAPVWLCGNSSHAWGTCSQVMPQLTAVSDPPRPWPGAGLIISPRSVPQALFHSNLNDHTTLWPKIFAKLLKDKILMT